MHLLRGSHTVVESLYNNFTCHRGKILLAAGFYIPVLKRISLLFSAKISQLKKEGSFDSNRGSLYKASRAIDLKNVRCHSIKMKNFNILQDIDSKEAVSNASKRSDEEAHNTITAPSTSISTALFSPTKRNL